MKNTELDNPKNSLVLFEFQDIFNNLINLKENITIIITTHNEKIIKYCDEVFDIKNLTTENIK